MLLLETVGRKSGVPRSSPLMYVHDGDNFVVIGSNNGGEHHPAWYHNLLAAPDAAVVVGHERIAVRARVAEGEERARLFAEADRVNRGGYTRYTKRTDRDIPVVVLERR
jgi:deazaflavin-dependent oxidoreductase (nitroreductase family)